MLLKLFISTVFLLNQISYAQTTPEVATTEVLPYLMNNTQNVEALLETVRPFVTDAELSFTREFLTKQGVSNTEALPKVVQKGNDLVVGDFKVSLVAGGGIKYDGTILRIKKQESFDQFVQRVHNTLTGKKEKGTSLYKLIFPHAEAKEVTYRLTNASGKAVAAVGVALTALLIGTTVFLGSPVVLAATLFTVAAVAASSLGIAMFASKNDARLFCNGKTMSIKSGGIETKYNFEKDRLQPSASITNAKGVTTKTIEKFEPETARALSTVYSQACESNKSEDINLALEKIQSKSFAKNSPTQNSPVQAVKGKR